MGWCDTRGRISNNAGEVSVYPKRKGTKSLDCTFMGRRVQNFGNEEVVLWKVRLTNTTGRSERELLTIVLAEKQSAHHSAPDMRWTLGNNVTTCGWTLRRKHIFGHRDTRPVNCPSRRNWKFWVHTSSTRMSFNCIVCPNSTIKISLKKQ